jgi:hypothetical protein
VEKKGVELGLSTKQDMTSTRTTGTTGETEQFRTGIIAEESFKYGIATNAFS